VDAKMHRLMQAIQDFLVTDEIHLWEDYHRLRHAATAVSHATEVVYLLNEFEYALLNDKEFNKLKTNARNAAMLLDIVLQIHHATKE